MIFCAAIVGLFSLPLMVKIRDSRARLHRCKFQLYPFLGVWPCANYFISLCLHFNLPGIDFVIWCRLGVCHRWTFLRNCFWDSGLHACDLLANALRNNAPEGGKQDWTEGEPEFELEPWSRCSRGLSRSNEELWSWDGSSVTLCIDRFVAPYQTVFGGELLSGKGHSLEQGNCPRPREIAEEGFLCEL